MLFASVWTFTDVSSVNMVARLRSMIGTVGGPSTIPPIRDSDDIEAAVVRYVV